jgi:hypothetical protein
MFSKDVKTQSGTTKRVVAGSKEDLNDAVKVAEGESTPVYPNINHPVQKGHDLVAVDADVNKVLVDGTGAHNSPNDAVNPFSTETDGDVKVQGLEEPAYKTVPVGDNDRAPVVEPSKAEVSAAEKDSKPANETR